MKTIAMIHEPYKGREERGWE